MIDEFANQVWAETHEKFSADLAAGLARLSGWLRRQATTKNKTSANMQAEIIRNYLAEQAPELRIIELPEAHTTDYISREWNVLPAQVAKTLTLRVGPDVKVVVTCGDSRLDNHKVKEVLGGKGSMIPGPEAAALTGHPVGGITPLCLAAPFPVFFDVRLQRFDQVVTAAGTTHSAIRIPPRRFAELVDAVWADICS